MLVLVGVSVGTVLLPAPLALAQTSATDAPDALIVDDPADFDAPPVDPPPIDSPPPKDAKQAPGAEREKDAAPRDGASAPKAPALGDDNNARDFDPEDLVPPSNSATSTREGGDDPYDYGETEPDNELSTSQTRDDIDVRPKDDPRPDLLEVAGWQVGATAATLFLSAVPVGILSYCTLGAFGCLVYPVLQGAVVTYIGNGIAKERKGMLLPALAGLGAQILMVALTVPLFFLIPGVGPLIPSIPGVNPSLLVSSLFAFTALSPVVAGTASILAWQFDDEGVYEKDPWKTLPPVLTVPHVDDEDEGLTPLSEIGPPSVGMRF